MEDRFGQGRLVVFEQNNSIIRAALKSYQSSLIRNIFGQFYHEKKAFARKRKDYYSNRWIVASIYLVMSRERHIGDRQGEDEVRYCNGRKTASKQVVREVK